MTTKLTIEQLEALNPCAMESRRAVFGKRRHLTFASALKAGVSIEDLLWVAGRFGRKDLCVRFALACAQRVAGNNPDPRVQAAIDAAANWLVNPCEENRSAATSAARSAEAAAMATAAWSAEAAWSAAAEAAEAAAAAAAWSAAAAAARSAEAAAAWSAMAAAEAAGSWLETAEQRRVFLAIFKDA